MEAHFKLTNIRPQQTQRQLAETAVKFLQF